jgi:uncharacterized protein (DUF433 family)
LRGLELRWSFFLEKLAAGENIEQIIEAHPRLTPQAIRAALAFAAKALKADVVYPISGDVA